MRRNNEERLMKGHSPQKTEEVPMMANPMDFVTPTEMIDLPSKGRYPEGHPLRGVESIEIKHMTAKDEDILTNRGLLKKGLAIDRLIQSVIKDKSINHQSLYIGDRNAIIVYSRAFAYGEDYKTKINCPNCGETNKIKFNLREHEIYHGDDLEDLGIEKTEDETFIVELPYSKIKAEIRPLMGSDELKIVAEEKNVMDNIITKQMKRFVINFNGYSDAKTINYVCDNMVAGDSKYLRNAFKLISPDIKMNYDFKCKNCEYEEVVSVPFGTDFFWPNE